MNQKLQVSRKITGETLRKIDGGLHNMVKLELKTTAFKKDGLASPRRMRGLPPIVKNKNSRLETLKQLIFTVSAF